MRHINIEGYSADEILNLPDEQVDEFVLCGRPIVFRAGSAEILGEFKINDESLIGEASLGGPQIQKHPHQNTE